MKALIVNGEELLRLSLREVAAVAARPAMILEAGSEHEFLSLTAQETHFDLIIIHPATMMCAKTGKGFGGDSPHNQCLMLVQRLFPTCPTLVIENVKRDHSHEETAGNMSFLPRHAPVAEMIRAIRNLLKLPTDMPASRANTIARPDVLGALQRPRTDTTSPSEQRSRVDLSRLSFRQKQILAMAADGLANKEIAARLDIAEGTVKAHMHAIFKVMGVSNRTQAVIRFSAAGSQKTHLLTQISA